jgi:hypothetical protein
LRVLFFYDVIFFCSDTEKQPKHRQYQQLNIKFIEEI